MRDAYHEELDAITGRLVQMTHLVRSAISRATSDLQMAESVISRDAEVNQLFAEIETSIFELMARQQPVAVDLRMMITALRMGSDLERMGDLAEHIEKVARMRFPEHAVPQEVRPVFLEAGHVAEDLVAKAGTVIAKRDITAAVELEADDDVMDRLHAQLFRELLSDDWPHGIESAIDVTLLGRYYERFADHAVSVARRVVYLVTGERSMAPAQA
jgi:phosphate transport system protein